MAFGQTAPIGAVFYGLDTGAILEVFWAIVVLVELLVDFVNVASHIVELLLGGLGSGLLLGLLFGAITLGRSRSV